MPGEVAPAAGQLAGALGLLDEQGHLNRAFFEHPLDSVRRALVDAKRRALLVQSLDELMERDPELSHSGPDELRAYPLADLDPHRLALALRLPGGTGAATVTLIVLARVVLESGASLDVEVPLVTGEADTRRAVCGTPDGPVRLRGSYPVTDTAVVSAEVTAHTGGGYLGLRLTGLVVDGTEVPPLGLRSDALRGDITHVLTSVLGVAAQALTGGGPAADVLTHLPGVLGLDPLIPPLPLAELARTPGTCRAWLASLVTGDAAGMRAWLGHVAGMAGLTSRLTGRPTPASPWTITMWRARPPSRWRWRCTPRRTAPTCSNWGYGSRWTRRRRCPRRWPPPACWSGCRWPAPRRRRGSPRPRRCSPARPPTRRTRCWPPPRSDSASAGS